MTASLFYKKRILITQNALHFISGSEIVTLELAEFLQSMGAEVIVFTWLLEEPMRTELKKRHITVTTDDYNLRFSRIDYVWVHHQVIPLGLLQHIHKNPSHVPYFIFNHMSAIDDLYLEQPYIISLEKTFASLNLFVSQESLDFNLSKYPTTFYHPVLFPNPAPDSFIIEKNNPKDIKKVLIVSNHPPQEIKEASQILQHQGIQVSFIGKLKGKYEVITPETLKNYDVVITIGKTVQYCLILNTPPYIYDHYGGCGYLNNSNYKKAGYANFSGRGFRKKTPERIAKELVELFETAQQFINKKHKQSVETFLLSQNLTRIFNNLPPKPRLIIISDEYLNSLKAMEMIARDKIIAENKSVNYSTILAEADGTIDFQKTKIKELELHINNLNNQINGLNSLINDYDNSHAVKIANALHRLSCQIKKGFKTIQRINYSLSADYKNEYIKKPTLSNNYQIIGLIREKNEALILDDTISELEKIVDGFIILDDNSNDDSIKIARQHPKCLAIIHHLKTVDGNRSMEESIHRQKLLDLARKYHPKWLIYQDADERIDDGSSLRHFMLKNLNNTNIMGIRLSLFDAYMTKKDHSPYRKGQLFNFRKMFGPERRDILFVWKNIPEATFMTAPDMREPDNIDNDKIITKFFVQHYGKSLSLEQWEETCDYYVNHFPQYAEKWQARKGKGIHDTLSDFKRPLISWEEAKKSGGVKIN